MDARRLPRAIPRQGLLLDSGSSRSTLGAMAQSKPTGRPCALLSKSGLVAAFLAGTGAGMVDQSAHADGIVRCWGYNYYGQYKTPGDLGVCSSVSMGCFHSIAIEAKCPQSPSSLDGNCIVSGVDLGYLMNAWGPCNN